MAQTNLPGKQTMQWEKQNKEAYIIQSANFCTAGVCFTIVVVKRLFQGSFRN